MEHNVRRKVTVKINIPFCVHRCEFCTRTIIGGRDTERLHFYAMAIQKEILANAPEYEDCEITAIHFGGGMASTLSGPDLYQIYKVLKDNYHMAENVPVTMRSTYLDINTGSLPFHRRIGLTRYDFEVMSLETMDFPKLQYLNTLHFTHDVNNVVRAAQFHNVGYVLLYGKDSITPINFRRSLLNVVRSHACHLILQRYEGSDGPSDDETAAARLHEARTLLVEHGFYEYLPLRFARKGYEDVYSMNRACGMEHIAFGMGAISCFDGIRSTNTMDLRTYFLHSNDYEKIIANAEEI